MDRNNIQNVIVYTMFDGILNAHAGNWETFNHYEEAIVESALKKGELFNTINYLWFYLVVNMENGKFLNTNLLHMKLSEIATAFDYDEAKTYASMFRSYLLVKLRKFSETLAEVERCFAISSKRITDLNLLQVNACKAEAQLNLNDVNGAIESIHKTQEIIDKQDFVPSSMSSYCFITQFIIDIYILKKAIISENTFNLSSLKKQVIRMERGH